MVDCRSPCGPIVAALDKWEWVVLGDFKAMQFFLETEGEVPQKKYLVNLLSQPFTPFRYKVCPFLQDYSNLLS